MTENTIKIELPADIFGKGATAQRLERVSIRRHKAWFKLDIQATREEFMKEFANIYPEWEGITDVDTGEPIEPLSMLSIEAAIEALEGLTAEQKRYLLFDGITHPKKAQNQGKRT